MKLITEFFKVIFGIYLVLVALDVLAVIIPIALIGAATIIALLIGAIYVEVPLTVVAWAFIAFCTTISIMLVWAIIKYVTTPNQKSSV